MLVDRILTIEGEPRSLTSGRVVTEHDIHPGAWYLDGGRIATCIAVEAGQADLFLSGSLGIDFQTRGLAVYRLLDAAVTFHRGCRGRARSSATTSASTASSARATRTCSGSASRAASTASRCLTMSDGCAGFFTAAELAAGKGIVQTALDRARAPAFSPTTRPSCRRSASNRIAPNSSTRFAAAILPDVSARSSPVVVCPTACVCPAGA